MIDTASDKVKIVDSCWSDVTIVSDYLRKADRDEIAASHGVTPLQALEQGFAKSEYCRTVVYKGQPIAMFGIVPDPDGTTSAIWFLGTDTVDQLHYCFGRMSKKLVAEFLDIYPYLHNYVDARNTKTIGWLKWCGAELEEPAPYGVQNLMFRHFIFRRKARV